MWRFWALENAKELSSPLTVYPCAVWVLRRGPVCSFKWLSSFPTPNSTLSLSLSLSLSFNFGPALLRKCEHGHQIFGLWVKAASVDGVAYINDIMWWTGASALAVHATNGLGVHGRNHFPTPVCLFARCWFS